MKCWRRATIVVFSRVLMVGTIRSHRPTTRDMVHPFHSRSVARRMRRAQILSVLCVLSLSACTYGPVQHRINIAGAVARPETRMFAAIVWSELRREPTGLAAFPDGGVPKIRDQSVTLYVADVDAQTVRRIGRIPVPAEVENSHGAFLLGWKGSAFYVQLSGCRPRPGSECWGPLERHIAFRAGEDGTITRVDSVPPNLEHEPGMTARAPGERVYMRISATHDSVFVLTEDGGAYTPRFALNRDGELVPRHSTR